VLVLREVACKDRTWKWLVLICCNACEIGNQTWWLIKDWSQYSCVLSLLEFEWCFRFTRSVLCSPPIQEKRKTWTIVWSNGKILVCRSWFKKRRPRGCWAPGSRHTRRRRSPPMPWGRPVIWEYLKLKAKGWISDLSAAVRVMCSWSWSSLRLISSLDLPYTRSQACGGDSNEQPEELKFKTCFLFIITIEW